MTTIVDVANHANVSVATVSRFFSAPDKLSKKTALRVREAVDVLKYTPNALARNLNRSRANAVMILLNDITNPFLARVVASADKVAIDRGYSVLLGNSHFSQDIEANYISRIQSRVVDGFIQVSSNVHDIMLDPNNTIPFVNLCECPSDANYPTVHIDNVAASREITELLINLGHQKIGCLMGIFNDKYPSPVTVDRLKGFQQALQRKGIKYHPEWHLNGDYSFESGYDAAEVLARMKDRPTAVVVGSDEMASGFIRGLKNKGIRVPEDISVTGFDDIPMARYSEPALTTVAQPSQKMGEVAMGLLLDLIEGKPLPKTQIKITHDIVVRESTMPPKI